MQKENKLMGRSLDIIKEKGYYFFCVCVCLMWTIFKVFTELVTTLLLFYVWDFWLWSMWDSSSLTRDQILTPCIGSWSLNHWIDRQGSPWNSAWLKIKEWQTLTHRRGRGLPSSCFPFSHLKHWLTGEMNLLYLCWPDSRYLQQISHPFDNFTFSWNTQNTKMKVSFHLYHLFDLVASSKQHRLV